jgi:hypothetical protein
MLVTAHVEADRHARLRGEAVCCCCVSELSDQFKWNGTYLSVSTSEIQKLGAKFCLYSSLWLNGQTAGDLIFTGIWP